MFNFLMTFIDNNCSAPLKDDPKDPKFWPIETRDFSYLEGKTVDYVYINGQSDEVIIAGLDYAVGLTLEKANGDRLACWHGPSYSKGADYAWEFMFPELIDNLENGFYSASLKYKALGEDVPKTFGEVSIQECAYTSS